MITFSIGDATYIIPEHRIMSILVDKPGTLKAKVTIVVMDDDDEQIKRATKTYTLTGKDANNFVLKYGDVF